MCVGMCMHLNLGPVYIWQHRRARLLPLAANVEAGTHGVIAVRPVCAFRLFDRARRTWPPDYPIRYTRTENVDTLHRAGR